MLLSPTQAGKVNSVGVASHWPCVIDDSGISTELTTYRKVDEPPPPTLLSGTAQFTILENFTTELRFPA